MTCPHCVGAEEFFNSKEATGDLKRYRSKGPMKTAQMLIDALRDAGVAEKVFAGYWRWRRRAAA